MNLRKKNSIMSIVNSTLIDLPAPTNLTHFWNFGSLLGICLFLQFLTGIFLAMHYSSSILVAFNCIDHIMRDVTSGWMLRLLHANGASLFFIAIFCHMGRGLYYKSYLLKMTWSSGILIFLLSMLTAFLGYVLPWGQMSFWGATVITNLLSALPYLGTFLVEWVWGGFSVNNSTLSRFFSLHYLFPFLILLMVGLHLVFLHMSKSSNPLGFQNSPDKIPFHPYFSLKDLMSLLFILFLFMILCFLFPFSLMDPDNFLPSNPMVTPIHIQPEWYFLFAYAILRAIPNKLGGVIALLLSILIFFSLLFKPNMNQYNKMNSQTLNFWFMTMIFFFLTWLGMKPVEEPFLLLSKMFTVFYFSWFLI